jgi:hypothetical protein
VHSLRSLSGGLSVRIASRAAQANANFSGVSLHRVRRVPIHVPRAAVAASGNPQGKVRSEPITRGKEVKNIVVTGVLLVIVFANAFFRRQADADVALAEKLLSSAEIERVSIPGPPTFRAGNRVALFFERRAMQGPIRGVVVVEDGRIADLMILRSREGINHDAFDSPEFLASFQGLPAKTPLTVQAISGASVSSQALVDAVSERLKQWAAHTKSP